MHSDEDVALVHEVGEPRSAGLLLELRAGVLALLGEQLDEAIREPLAAGRGQEPR